MADQEPMCWVSKEPTNNDQVYHTDKCCYQKKRIHTKNLAKITVREAISRGMPHCSNCKK